MATKLKMTETSLQTCMGNFTRNKQSQPEFKKKSERNKTEWEKKHRDGLIALVCIRKGCEVTRRVQAEDFTI